jgi:Xaa-Pro dipeptidase
MIEKNIDILLITNRENFIYFTGLTLIECVAIIIPSHGEPSAITLQFDSKYLEEESGIKTYGYLFPKETLVSKTVEIIKKYGLHEPRIGFERYFVDYALYDGLRRNFSEKNFVGAGDILYRVRSIKEPQEVELMRKAASAVCKGMEAAIKNVRPGITELDVLAEAEYTMFKAGSGGSSFRPQVVSGERSLLTHPCASNKIINAGHGCFRIMKSG